jgi:hypothetical protein
MHLEHRIIAKVFLKFLLHTITYQGTSLKVILLPEYSQFSVKTIHGQYMQTDLLLPCRHINILRRWLGNRYHRQKTRVWDMFICCNPWGELRGLHVIETNTGLQEQQKRIQLYNKSGHNRLKYRTTESSYGSPYQKVMILFEERRKSRAKFLNVCFDVTRSADDLHKFLSVRSKSHGNLPPNRMNKSPKQIY